MPDMTPDTGGPTPVPNPQAAQVVQPAPSPVNGQPPASTPQQTPPPVSQPSAASQVLGGASQHAPITALSPRDQKAAVAGHGFHAVMQALEGKSDNWVQTPNGPVNQPVQNKPGQFFRSLLAGVLTGAAAGAGHGWEGAGLGAQAAAKQQQGIQEKSKENAQQQFENKQKATQFDTEQQLRKAQLAQANAETLRTNVMTQGASYDLHQKIADADAKRISTFEDAGVKPVYKDVTESEMTDYLKNNPGAGSLDWRHTGVKTVLDKDGNPSYEYTLSAYDPKEKVPLSAATVKQWKDDGLFKYHPEYETMAATGKTLTVDQFTALDRQAQNFFNQDLAKNKTQLETQHLQAQIDEAHSAIREHDAQTAHENLSSQELKEEKTRKDMEDTAWDHLAKVGNDPDKLTDPHDRAVLARSVQPLMQETLTGIKTAAAEAQSGDKAAEAELPDLWAKYNTYSKLASLNPGQTPQLVQVTLANGQTGVIPSDKLDAFLKANPGAKKADGSASTTPPASPSLISKVKKVNDAIGDKVGSELAPVKSYLERLGTGLVGGKLPADNTAKEAP